jgi:hypothetical protein
MNDKILNFAIQSGADLRGDAILTEMLDIEKFAKLIIRRSILRMEHEDPYYGEWMGNVLMMHFNLTRTELDLPLEDEECEIETKKNIGEHNFTW